MLLWPEPKKNYLSLGQEVEKMVVETELSQDLLPELIQNFLQQQMTKLFLHLQKKDKITKKN